VSNVPTKNSWVCPCHFCIVWLTSRYIPVYHYSRFDRSLDTLDSSVVKRQRQFSLTIQPSQEGGSLGYRWTFAVDCARNFDLNRAADRSEHTYGSTELWRLYPLVKSLVRWLPWESHNFVYRVASIEMFGSFLSAVSHSFVSTSCVCVCYNGKQGYAYIYVKLALVRSSIKIGNNPLRKAIRKQQLLSLVLQPLSLLYTVCHSALKNSISHCKYVGNVLKDLPIFLASFNIIPFFPQFGVPDAECLD
jgi:hypothetical protein